MRQIDNMTPQEIEVLQLKGMTAPRTASERNKPTDPREYGKDQTDAEFFAMIKPNKAQPQHSPLPWLDTDRHDNPKTCDPFVKIDNERSGIAYVFGDTKPEREANAKLIVRAVNGYDKAIQALRDLTKEIKLGTLNVRKDYSLMVAHAAATKVLYESEAQ